MKVKNLIKQLQKMPQEFEIFTWYYMPSINEKGKTDYMIYSADVKKVRINSGGGSVQIDLIEAELKNNLSLCKKILKIKGDTK